MALFGAAWLWSAIVNGVPVLYSAAAAVGAITFAVWVAAFWISRRRQAERERAFGNSRKDEIGRNLSLVECQIANGRWRPALTWSVPVLVGSLLIYWLSFQVNTDTGMVWWNHALMVVCILWTVRFTAWAGDREVKGKLEPRRQHLRELLDALDAGDWHGTVAGSTGDTTIVLHVQRGADGVLVAGLENRDVAPGTSAPVVDLVVADGRLTFRVPAVRATYEGAWDEAAQHWRGAMTTGRALPLNLAKGSPPPKPLVKGLDGRWEATVEANGATLRQVLRFSSGEWAPPRCSIRPTSTSTTCRSAISPGTGTRCASRWPAARPGSRARYPRTAPR